MGAGYWLNPDTGQCVRVATTHDEWVRDRGNAEGIGLPEAAYDAIMQYPATAVDEIRLVVLNWGLVRIREHPRYTSVQFAAHAHQVTPILRAVLGVESCPGASQHHAQDRQSALERLGHDWAGRVGKPSR